MPNVRNSQTPPDHLSEKSKAPWLTIIDEYDTESPAALEILRSVLELTDRAEDAAATLRKEGMVVEDQRGIPKDHPLIAVVIDVVPDGLSAGTAGVGVQVVADDDHLRRLVDDLELEGLEDGGSFCAPSICAGDLDVESLGDDLFVSVQHHAANGVVRLVYFRPVSDSGHLAKARRFGEVFGYGSSSPRRRSTWAMSVSSSP